MENDAHTCRQLWWADCAYSLTPESTSPDHQEQRPVMCSSPIKSPREEKATYERLDRVPILQIRACVFSRTIFNGATCHRTSRGPSHHLSARTRAAKVRRGYSQDASWAHPICDGASWYLTPLCVSLFLHHLQMCGRRSHPSAMTPAGRAPSNMMETTNRACQDSARPATTSTADGGGEGPRLASVRVVHFAGRVEHQGHQGGARRYPHAPIRTRSSSRL